MSTLEAINLRSLTGAHSPVSRSAKSEAALKPVFDFRTLLDGKIAEKNPVSKDFTISNHAQERLEQRRIPMTQTDKAAIAEALGLAQSKGARDALVLHGSNAYIFNVKTRTMVTAIDQASIKGNVFTNIDSTVFA